MLVHKFHFRWGEKYLLEPGRKEQLSRKAHISHFMPFIDGKSGHQSLVRRSSCLAPIRLGEEGVISSPSVNYSQLRAE